MEQGAWGWGTGDLDIHPSRLGSAALEFRRPKAMESSPSRALEECPKRQASLQEKQFRFAYCLRKKEVIMNGQVGGKSKASLEQR